MAQFDTHTYTPLVRSGGALVLDDLLDQAWLSALRSECAAGRSHADEQSFRKSPQDDQCDSNPERFLATADGGEVQTAIYFDPELWRVLKEMTGRPVEPTGSSGTYSYYDRPGHFIGLHRDIRSCDLTLVTCLQLRDTPGGSAALRTYPKDVRSPISEIGRSSFRRDIQVGEGQSVLLAGGCVPHEVLPAAPGFSRHVSVLCFRMC